MAWEELSKTLVYQARVFSLYAKRMRSKKRNYEDDFYVIHSQDWVHVVPITADQQVVFVEQHRHGIGAQSLECPGGLLDYDEDPKVAALRELKEETGYTGEQIISLGVVHPNPAIQNNRCHLFAVENVRLTDKQNLDPAEDIKVITHPVADIPAMISQGAITHALCVLSLQYYLLNSKNNL